VEANGMKYLQHCCGQVQAVLDNLYAVGVRRIDNPYSSEADIRREVRRCIDEYAPGKKLGIVVDESMELKKGF
jgi:hypothetical protein